MKLSEYELGVAQVLVGKAMAKAAGACGQMTTIDFQIHDFVLEQSDDWQQIWSDKNHESETFFVLTTRIKGDWQGINYLLLGHNQTKQILSAMAAGCDYAPGKTLSEFEQAILLELDNIVSGAFVSQLANVLSGFVYGDVPCLREMKHQQAISALENETSGYGAKITTSVDIRSGSTTISLQFICFFQEQFVLGIQQMISQNKHLELTKS